MHSARRRRSTLLHPRHAQQCGRSDRSSLTLVSSLKDGLCHQPFCVHVTLVIVALCGGVSEMRHFHDCVGHCAMAISPEDERCFHCVRELVFRGMHNFAINEPRDTRTTPLNLVVVKSVTIVKAELFHRLRVAATVRMMLK